MQNVSERQVHQPNKKRNLTLIFLTLITLSFSLSVSAQDLSAKKIDLQLSDVSLKEALQQIQQLSNIKFIYGQDINRYSALKINILQKDISVKSAIELVLKNTNLRYTQKNDHVMIDEKPVSTTSPTEPVAAQQTGTLAGTILDDRGISLLSATVSIIETANSVLSSSDGFYQFTLSPGIYTMEISFTGYKTRRINGIRIQPGRQVELDIVMEHAPNTLNTVVVSSNFSRASVEGHFARQKNAASVTDGISATQIARTPDNDMGQALKRISGVTTVGNKNVVVRGMSERYNQAMVDGVVIPSTSMNKRNFSFDIIPTEIVSDVVVNKTATPDKSSEFSGGQVSINTLDIPNENFTTLTIGTGGNSQTTGKDFYRLGERHTSEFLGIYHKSAKAPEGITPWVWANRAIQLNTPPGVSNDPELSEQPLNFENRNLKFNDLDAIAQSKTLNHEALKLNRYKGSLNQNYRFALGRVYTLRNDLRFGFTASANFRNEQNITPFNNVRGSTYGGFHFIDSTGTGQNGAGMIYRFTSSSGAVANMALQGKKFKVSLKNIYARNYENHYNEAIRLNYSDITNVPNKELYQLPEAMALRQHQLNVEYQLPWGIKLEAMGTVNAIQQQILDERKLKYRMATKLGGKAYFQVPNLFLLSQAGGSNLENDSRMWANTNETDYNWSFNFSKTINKSSDFSTLIKTGYQGWSKHRTMDILRMLPMGRSPLAGESFPIVENTYEYLLHPDNIGWAPDKAYYYAENINGRLFDGRMKNHAAYLMADQRLWRKLRIIYGARLEYYDLNNRQDMALKRTFGGEIPETLKYKQGVEEKDWRLLPSVNLVYSLSSDINLRASYSKTVIRPDFRESGMFGMWDNELGATISGDMVTSTIIDNYDVRFEWYPGPGEIMSLTAYYKNLDAPMELVRNLQLPNSLYYVYTNMESAVNKGLEMEIRKNFSFIADKEWLHNLFFYANGTLLQSTVNVLGPWRYDPDQGNIRVKDRNPSQDRPLLGQSPWLLNLGLGYWGEKFGLTASFNQRGYRANLTDLMLNAVEFEKVPRQIDAQVYLKVLKQKGEIKVNLANLLNEWTIYYTNSNIQIDRGDGQGWVNHLGDSRYNKADGDVIVFRKRDGQRFGINFTYSF